MSSLISWDNYKAVFISPLMTSSIISRVVLQLFCAPNKHLIIVLMMTWWVSASHNTPRGFSEAYQNNMKQQLLSEKLMVITLLIPQWRLVTTVLSQEVTVSKFRRGRDLYRIIIKSIVPDLDIIMLKCIRTFMKCVCTKWANSNVFLNSTLITKQAVVLRVPSLLCNHHNDAA